MDIRHSSRAALVVMAALLLVTFAFAVAPVGGKAFAEEAPKTTAVAATTTAAPAESAEPKAEEGKEGASAEKKEEIPHKVGNPTPAQLQDLRYAWASIPGFDLLLVSILGMIVAVGVIGFGIFKQSKV